MTEQEQKKEITIKIMTLMESLIAGLREAWPENQNVGDILKMDHYRLMGVMEVIRLRASALIQFAAFFGQMMHVPDVQSLGRIEGALRKRLAESPPKTTFTVEELEELFSGKEADQ